MTSIVIIFLLTGLVSGFIAGLLGVGGGIIIVPVSYFILLNLGYNSEIVMHVAVASSLGVICFTSISSIISHIKLKNINLQKELNEFLKDRFKYYLKEKEIRYDITEAIISSFSLNKIFSSYEKARCLNKVINNQIGLDIILTFKRASNILENEMKNNKIEIDNTTDPGIFKSDFEKNLYKKVNEIQKYYSAINNDENYEKSLSILADAKKEVFEFFDNVKVNEENETLRKNRLELINMLCKTFQNFTNFQMLKTSNE